MIRLDGSYCEGGGQIVRTALALSALTQQPFEIDDIRKGRCSAGLKSQHLYCVNALQELCNAKAEGNLLGSQSIKFYPGKIEGKEISIDIGTAGSVTLLLQALLLPCMFADKKTTLRIKGGTDGKWAMPFDYFKEVFLPHIRDFAEIELKLVNRGYYPKGGGEIELGISPIYKLNRYDNFSKLLEHLRKQKKEFNLIEQGKLVRIEGVSHASSRLKKSKVAERQAVAAKERLKQLDVPVNIRTEYCDTLSAGTGIVLWGIFWNNKQRIGADSLGELGKKAETVGAEAAERLINEINYKAPVDEYLADNLVPFLALFHGKIKVAKISNHALTNIYIVEKFLGKVFDVDKEKRIIRAIE